MNRVSESFCLSIILACWVTGALAMAENPGISRTAPDPDLSAGYKQSLFIAQAEEATNQNSKPKSGTLVMPADYEQKESSKEKTCIRVCSDWGETCVYDINKGRKCRRTCKATAMECFEQ